MAKLFGDAIVFAEGEKAIKIIDADAKREKALNEVLQKHTYKNRLNEILQVAGVEINDSLPEVTLIYQIRNLQDANLAEEHYNAILWNNKKMIFVADESDGATLLRKCLELYQCPRKEVLPRTCVNTLIIKSQYCIFANLNLSHDFIFRAVPHTSYIDMDQTGIVEAPNEQKYMFNKINGLDNVLIKTRSSNGELIDEKIRHLEGVGPILFNNPSPIVQLYNI
jgi:hypothetical protein